MHGVVVLTVSEPAHVRDTSGGRNRDGGAKGQNCDPPAHHFANPSRCSVAAGSGSSNFVTASFCRPFSSATPAGGSPTEKVSFNRRRSFETPALRPVS